VEARRTIDAELLACPVRGCGAELTLEERTLRCPQGHAFDLARRGSVNLLQPQDRRSREPGDAREAVEARARVAARGLLAPVLEAVLPIVRELDGERARVLDVGCGTGWLLAELAARRELRAVGIDLSAHAIELAARDHPGPTWVVANADRRMPLPDGVFDLALSITGPKPAAELARVLAPGGLLAVGVPAPDDLIELRAAVFGEGREEERVAKTLAALGEGFALETRVEVRSRPLLDADAQRDLLASTYRAGRRSREERAAALEAREVTLACELLVLRAT
jgi:23S rRNA (guanine745-N1)-methyltransferase